MWCFFFSFYRSWSKLLSCDIGTYHLRYFVEYNQINYKKRHGSARVIWMIRWQMWLSFQTKYTLHSWQIYCDEFARFIARKTQNVLIIYLSLTQYYIWTYKAGRIRKLKVKIPSFNSCTARKAADNLSWCFLQSFKVPRDKKKTIVFHLNIMLLSMMAK